jgi:DNA mismatch repair protein MutS2
LKIQNKKKRLKEAKAIVEKKKEVVAEISVHVDEIRKEKKEKLKPIIEKVQVTLRLGDRVRMISGKAVGTLENIEKIKQP